MSITAGEIDEKKKEGKNTVKQGAGKKRERERCQGRHGVRAGDNYC